MNLLFRSAAATIDNCIKQVTKWPGGTTWISKHWRAPRIITFSLRDRQPARIGGQLTDDLTAVRLRCIHPAPRCGRRKRTSPSYCSHPLRERMIARRAHVDAAAEAAGLESRLGLGRAIGA